ncbi:MAG: DNA mismatch repair protein MutS [Spirochaetaceae bacterium]
MAETTPMMRQYRKIKEKHGDAVLFFRLGDFYEMFDRDAVMVSALLNLTLTHRNGLPMCGIPYHSSRTYIPRLLKHGKKIAICEQTSLPEKGKGIVDREVVEVITPGTVTEEEYLEGNRNNFIVSLGAGPRGISLAALDITTGEFTVRLLEAEEHDETLREELSRLDPSEVLIQESLLEERRGIARYFSGLSGTMVNRYPDWYFDVESSYRRLLRQFSVHNLKGFGFSEEDPHLLSCGVLLDYLEENSKHILSHISSLKRIEEDMFMGLDEATQKNLELTKNLSDRSEHYTLLEVVDSTKTPMGGRMIRSWILYPLREADAIHSRQEKVERLYKEQLLLSAIRSQLSSIRDIERLASRVALDKAHGKDLRALAHSLETIFEVSRQLSSHNIPLSTFSRNFEEDFHPPLKELHSLLENAVHEDPPITLSEGRLIREGYNGELDSLRNLKNNSKNFLNEYLEEEKNSSGIPNLKIKYNRIIGYFLEVTKSHTDRVPGHFIRKQSLVGSERYSTEKLNRLEEELNNASESIVELEKRLFVELRDSVKEYLDYLMEASFAVAALDSLQSFAHTATVYGWLKPNIHDGSGIAIHEGRHPVVEAHSEAGSFIPNSIELDSSSASFALITGPNMSGKSTYLRQAALIVLLGQSGSFVPADEADIGTVDRIFCRVGASDNLARGESTFLVEMNETAYILNTAGPSSLVIMDEVGRGTSTGDGLSIAWAVSEFLLDRQIKTLFATHYHEITALENSRIKKLHLQVKEENGEIIFLKRVREGSAGKSYGLHVAKLAGLPEEVLRRAEELLVSIETRERELGHGGISAERENGENGIAGEGQEGEEILFARKGNRKRDTQQSLFSSADLILQELKHIDINRLTPLEALTILERWQREKIEKTE